MLSIDPQNAGKEGRTAMQRRPEGRHNAGMASASGDAGAGELPLAVLARHGRRRAG